MLETGIGTAIKTLITPMFWQVSEAQRQSTNFDDYQNRLVLFTVLHASELATISFFMLMANSNNEVLNTAVLFGLFMGKVVDMLIISNAYRISYDDEHFLKSL